MDRTKLVTSEASWVARGGQPLSRTFGQMQCVLGQVQGIFGQKQRAKRLWSDTRRSDAKHLWSEAKCLWSDASIFGRKRCAFSHMQNIFGQMQNIFGHKKTRMVRGRVPLTRCGKVLADCYCCCQQIVVFLLLRFSTTAVKQPQTKTELKGRRSYTLLLAAAVPLLLALQSPLPPTPDCPDNPLTTLWCHTVNTCCNSQPQTAWGHAAMSGRRSQAPLGDSHAAAVFLGIHPHYTLRLDDLMGPLHVPLVHRRPLLQVPARRLTSTMLHGLHAFGLAAQ